MNAQPRRGRPTQAQALVIERRLRVAAVEAFVDSGFGGHDNGSRCRRGRDHEANAVREYADKAALFAAVIPQALADMPFLGVAIEVPDDNLTSALRHLVGQIIAVLLSQWR